MVWVANGSAARERRSRSSSDGDGKASARRRRRRGANLLSRGQGGAPEACAVSRKSDAVARAPIADASRESNAVARASCGETWKSFSEYNLPFH